MLTFQPEPIRVDLSMNGIPIGTLVIKHPTKRTTREAGRMIAEAMRDVAERP